MREHGVLTESAFPFLSQTEKRGGDVVPRCTLGLIDEL
jgi:hypothetical protein